MQRKAVVSVLRDFVNYRKIHRPPSHKAECATYQMNCTNLLGVQWRELSLLPHTIKGSPFVEGSIWTGLWTVGRISERGDKSAELVTKRSE